MTDRDVQAPPGPGGKESLGVRSSQIDQADDRAGLAAPLCISAQEPADDTPPACDAFQRRMMRALRCWTWHCWFWPCWAEHVGPFFYCWGHCIPLDITFKSVYSTSVLCVCMLTTFVMLGSNSVMGSFSSSTCVYARHVQYCGTNGEALNVAGEYEMKLDPSEETLMVTVDNNTIGVLVAVLLMALANSRHFGKFSPGLSMVMLVLALVGNLAEVAWYGSRLSVCSTNLLDYSSFLNKWAPTDEKDWHPPVREYDTGARDIMEYCSVDASSSVFYSAPEVPAKLTKAAQGMWVAWMAYPSFLDSLIHDRKGLLELCDRLGFTSDSGLLPGGIEHATCVAKGLVPGLITLAPLQFDVTSLVMCQKVKLLLPKGNFNKDTACCLFYFENGNNSEASSFKCQATVHGLAYTVPNVLNPYTVKPAVDDVSQIAKVLLSVAARGIGCGNDNLHCELAEQHCGPRQAPFSRFPCTYASEFVERDPVTSTLNFTADAKEYMNEAFFQCVANTVMKCAVSRSVFPAVTEWRNVLLLLMCMLCFLASGWLCYLRVAVTWNFQRPMVQRALRSAIRELFSSRVIVALFTALVLEIALVSIFWWQMAENWSYLGAGYFTEQLNIYPRWLLKRLVDIFALGHMITFTLAVAFNARSYLELRRNLFMLPPESVYGTEEQRSRAPQQLEEIVELGESSILFAAWFPGLVFWNFAVGASFLMLIVCLLFGTIFLTWRAPGAERMAIAPHFWKGFVWVIFTGSIMASHWFQRLYAQKCLFNFKVDGLEIKRLCFFTWYEILYIFIGFAVGPYAALYNFGKAIVTSAFAMLFIDKPNFTQFGEFSDLSFCSFCAVLYLERVGHDYKQGQLLGANQDEEESSAGASPASLDTGDTVDIGTSMIYRDLPSMSPETSRCWISFGSAAMQFLIFWAFLILVPAAVWFVLNAMGTHWGYDCINLFSDECVFLRR
eukprot:TRINITY_DN4327_c0_g1_i8.p1 TRINITY_DN4327_c0_g1~~TRINITY_DN4327_c0_g1_i8.p1  ORF type:complete len:952 (+),score=66.33 TRINITY_DN4327_c0_g1_i8:55-2910(+)